MTHDASLLTGTWQVDPAQSDVSCWLAQRAGSVRVTVADVDATIEIGASGPESGRVRAALGLDSLASRDAARDLHLREVLDAAAHPQITFESTSVTVRGRSILHVAGALTVRGVARPVTFVVTIVGVGESRLATVLNATLSCADLGLDATAPLDAGGPVDDAIEVEATLEAVRV